MNEVVKVIYKHWQKDIQLEVIGKLIPVNPQSERIVVMQDDGKFEDIIKDTIVEITPL
jgi:hypothetical protein